jgi:hypothetical protein
MLEILILIYVYNIMNKLLITKQMIETVVKNILTDFGKLNEMNKIEQIREWRQKQFESFLNIRHSLYWHNIDFDSPRDVMTFEEAVYSSETPLNETEIQNAIEEGYVTVYSTAPIKPGVCVTTSLEEVKNYIIGGKFRSINSAIPFMKKKYPQNYIPTVSKVKINEIAWQDGYRGIYLYENILNESVNRKNDEDYRNCLFLRYNLPFVEKIRDAIDPKDLYINEKEGIEGYETDTHVTVFFGLHHSYNTVDCCFSTFENQIKTADVKTLFNGISFFENEKFDVMKLDVVSPVIEDANRLIRYRSDCNNRFKNFIPHCTIAYLKKGMAKKYAYMGDFEINVLKTPYEWVMSSNRKIIDVQKNDLYETKTFMDARGDRGAKYTFLYEFINTTAKNNTTYDMVKNFPLLRGKITFDKDHPAVIQITFDEENREIIKPVISRMDAYGWFVNNKDYQDSIIQLLNGETSSIVLFFEPRNSEELEWSVLSNKHLYHVTPTDVWENKISKIGLCPKSQSKKANHPERVYLFPEIQIKDGVWQFLNEELSKAKNRIKEQNENDESCPFYSILEIKINPSLIYKGRMKFFQDPYSNGIWTSDNIPPEWITEYGRYTLDRDYLTIDSEGNQVRYYRDK